MISRVNLRNFRNHTDLSVDFDAGSNLIVGPNGSGKTSILEAIYMTLQGASWRGSNDDIVKDDADWATAEVVVADDNYRLKLDGREGALIKTRLINDQPKRTGYPNVMLLEPTAIELVVGGPRTRRDWADEVLSRSEVDYARKLKQYSRALSQRNALLKREVRSPDQLFVWNIKLAELGAELVAKRQQLVDDSTAEINRLFGAVAGYSKGLEVAYQTKFATDEYTQQFMDYLEANLERDIAIGFTPAGPHRDDIALRVDGGVASDYLSRGEQQILAFSLIYAQSEMLNPVAVLLDDFTSDLDQQRAERLSTAVAEQKIVATVKDNGAAALKL